ncbi:hypothetical protein BJF79_19010 [Actinomadura sp. CNU-125]|uniref:hypothetical protein n=1 Tax=Actinomadura sp. CNU-125 TaxID=1904961 RepID=UPI000958ED9B|nr:hypothetical protein [Actinomadura sp. CNU-125]OLT14555.1 hypothetical protein BJF79_19010 [Actinomadura sp. CNU-125]
MDDEHDEGGRPGAAGRFGSRGFAALAFGVLLLVASSNMFHDRYQEPGAVLRDGVPGMFELDRCKKIRNLTDSCHGSFRSDDGRVVRERIRLFNRYDAADVESGKEFPARLRVREPGGHVAEMLVRSDGVGRDNVRERGIGAAGLGVAALAMFGFAARRAVTAPGSAARRVTGYVLGCAVFAGVAVWQLLERWGGGPWGP